MAQPFDWSADNEFVALARIEALMEHQYYLDQMDRGELFRLDTDIAAGFNAAVKEIDRVEQTKLARAVGVLR